MANGILDEASQIKPARWKASFKARSPFENDQDHYCPGILVTALAAQTVGVRFACQHGLILARYSSGEVCGYKEIT